MRAVIALFLLSWASLGCQNTTSTGDLLGATFYTAPTPPIPVLKISPESVTVQVNSSITFTASGGVKPYTYSISNNVGAINATTGVYSSAASDVSTVIVKDSAGGSAIAIVSTYTVGQSPNGMSGLKRWYKADSVGSAGFFTSWPDSSGNGFPATSGNGATLVNNVYNGQPTVRFIAGNNLAGWNLPATANTTLFMVAKASAAGNVYAVYGSSGSGSPAILSNFFPNRAFEIYWADAGGTDRQTIRGPTDAGLNLLTIVRNSTTSLLNGYHNSYQTVNMGTQTNLSGGWQWLGFSNANAYVGDISEFMIFDVALSDATRQAIECYLMLKHGIISASTICQ